MPVRICTVKGCYKEGQYCRLHFPGEKPKEPKPIAQVSEKRKKINSKELAPVLKELKKSGDRRCQINSPVCIKTPCHSHHVRGRIGKNLTNKKEMIRACDPCNGYVEARPEWAKALGFKKSMHDPNYTRVK